MEKTTLTTETDGQVSLAEGVVLSPAAAAPSGEPSSHANRGLRIGDVARRLGLSTHTIRAWERRHGLVRPLRSPNGERTYTEANVQHLLLIQETHKVGYALKDIARLSTEELSEILARARALGETPAPPPAEPDPS
ncbi:MAG TPA: MerR family transcriptional regulator [Polyangiaceae bacterium]|nr:MerR family transcriptional regulator [Polyangiaceae bacterium]